MAEEKASNGRKVTTNGIEGRRRANNAVVKLDVVVKSQMSASPRYS